MPSPQTLPEIRRFATKVVRPAAITGAVLLALAVGIGWYGSDRALRPPWYEPRTPAAGLQPHDGDYLGRVVMQGLDHDPTTDLGLAYETVEFPAVDGSTLRGWFVPAGPDRTVGVVTVHGGGGDRREFLRHLPFLHETGYPVLLFDCREQGISDGTGRGLGFGLRKHEDVSAAVRYLKTTRRAKRVAVLGDSQGGAAVILAAAADPAIDAVIAENPFTSVRDVVRDSSLRRQPAPDLILRFVSAVVVWRVAGLGASEPIDVVNKIAPRPLLLMHGTADRVIPAFQSEALYERAGEPKELWLVEGADHSQLFNREPVTYRARVLAFLARWLIES